MSTATSPVLPPVMFEVLHYTMGIICVVSIPEEAATERYGRMVVYRLAAKVEQFAPACLRGPTVEWRRPSWPKGPRGEIHVRTDSSGTDEDVLRCLNKAIAAVQRELAFEADGEWLPVVAHQIDDARVSLFSRNQRAINPADREFLARMLAPTLDDLDFDPAELRARLDALVDEARYRSLAETEVLKQTFLKFLTGETEE